MRATPTTASAAAATNRLAIPVAYPTWPNLDLHGGLDEPRGRFPFK